MRQPQAKAIAAGLRWVRVSTGAIIFSFLAIFFTFLAASFLLMHGYVEDVGMAPANKLVEVIVFAS